MKRVKRDKINYSTPGLILTFLLFVPSLKYFVNSASQLATENGNILLLFLYLMVCYIIVLFQFHHVDEYTQQRGKDVNIIGLILFTLFTVGLITN